MAPAPGAFKARFILTPGGTRLRCAVF
jgi:hypothetical protein